MKFIDIQHFTTSVGEFIQGEFEGRLCILDYRHRRKRDFTRTQLIPPKADYAAPDKMETA